MEGGEWENTAGAREREVVWEHRHQLLKTKGLGMMKRIKEDPETDPSAWENGVRVRKG